MLPRAVRRAASFLAVSCALAGVHAADGSAAPSPPGAPAVGAVRLAPRRLPAKPAHSTVPNGYDPRRICVKFRDGLDVGVDPSGLPATRGEGALRSARSLDVLRRSHQAGGRWRRASGLDRETLARIRSRAESALHREIADFSTYFVLTLPAGARSPDWMDALNALPEVELASPLPLPATPPSPPDLEPVQGYLDSATVGSDFRFIWTVPGGTGVGVSICDLEYAWNLEHEDLPPATVLLPDGSTPVSFPDEEYHGTAVLGEMFSRRNGWGMTGASYDARCYVAPVVLDTGPALFEQILLATSRLEAGDILLIEEQTFGPYSGGGTGQFGGVPIEWAYPVYEAIVAAVGNGLHVVEPAGNGSQNLDDPVYGIGNDGHAPFLPENNSGAIMVGAGVPPFSPWRGTDRSCLEFSDYGSRLDVQGWGVDVPTLGGGDLYSAEGPNLLYTRMFGGTSAAGPLVASAVAAIEGIVEHNTGRPVDPAVMRALLSETGSPQQSGPRPATERIGPRPDLRAAYGRMTGPIVAAPAAFHAYEGDTVRLTVHAADLDGDPIASLTAGALPPGAVFTVNGDWTAGTLEWATARGQAGTYPVTFTAANSMQAGASTLLTIESAERGPVVTTPGGVWGVEDYPLTVKVSAVDPNGDPIVSFEASDLPAGATFTTDSTRTHGTLHWRPDYTQAGQYVVTFTAVSVTGGMPGGERLSDSAPLVMTIENRDRSPAVSAPASVTGAEGQLLAFLVTAADPDGDAVTRLRAEVLPAGAAFTADASNTSGTFSWTPGYTQAGGYWVDFVASNGPTGRARTTITIQNVDRPPLVAAPDEVTGTEETDVSFDATASDPDLDPILSLVAAGLPPGSAFTVDGSSTHGHFAWHPRFGQAGEYSITLTASARSRQEPATAPPLSASATVRVLIRPGIFPARVFLPPEDRTFHVGSGRPQACVRLEPVDTLFDLTEILPDSVAMLVPGTGSVARILAVAEKSSPIADRDRNGIADLPACFSREDLQLLFAGIPPGRCAVGVTVEGALRSGRRFRGAASVEVFTRPGQRDARVTPNPVRAGAIVSFRTSVAGPVRLRVFDAQGRLVHTALDAPALSPGDHDVPLWAGTDAPSLPTGVYFYRLESREGETRGRFVILK